ncbi:acyl-CoA binding protein [Maribacter vaceletii]|uniref:Acyl-CoA binding protein n=1 Tax=Maribacter vaceletii TaxID=1206816 RepID=A0A495DSA1_9FLAO|nr:acyl-CoA-binding protein [Maribacter vaceletii]RKR06988.1 acyl-CoA binding protein [Maribacter vaceletii]
MKNKKLYNNYLKTVDYINSYNDPIPPDILLKLYAYYRIANKNHSSPGSKTPLINAFKANALIQAKKYSVEDAMREYILLVEKELK